MSQVMEILALQEVEDEAGASRSNLAILEERLARDEALEAARAEAETAASEHTAASELQARLEAQVAQLVSRITAEEKRLYEGSVKLPKELSSIQHEVDGLKAQKAKLEEELLGVLSVAEEAQARHQRAATTLAQEEARRSRETAELTASVERLTAEADDAERQAAARRARIAAPALTLYDSLRKRKGGAAVVRIQGQSCSGCRISIPEMMRKRALSPVQLAQCPNCERILYVG